MTVPETPSRPGFLRRHAVPILGLLAVGLIRFGIALMERFDVQMEYYIEAMTVFQISVMLLILVLGVWFFFFSGYPRSLRVGVALGLVVCGVAAAASIQTLEFDGEMTPRVVFRWDQSAEEALKQHLAQSGPTIGGASLIVGPNDSPSYRGSRGDGQARGATLSADWTTPPRELWRHPVGGGHAGIAVAGNSAVTLEQREGDEVIVCYDRESGQERWKYAYAARFTQSEPMGGDGPRTTPAIADNLVISIGGRGDMVCVDATTGQFRWRVNIMDDNQATVPEWGVSISPVVHGSRIFVNAGVNLAANANQAVAAYDLSTGKKLWANGNKPVAYASPQVLTLGGLEQVVVFDAVGLGGYDLASGVELWRHAWKTAMNMNSAQPLLVGTDRILISSEKSNGAAVIEIRSTDGKWTTREVWKSRVLSARFCNPVLVGDHIYCLSDGYLVCVNATSGKRAWIEGSFGNGQLVAAGDKLVITAEKGPVVLVAADPTEYRELGQRAVFTARTWNVPALAGNQLLARNHREMVCLELPVQ